LQANLNWTFSDFGVKNLSMQFDFSYFLAALGLAFIIEGLPYFLWAEKMPQVLNILAQRPPSLLRGMGFMTIIFGLIMVFVARRF
jgi:uncharacterized protein YjeT (DUF2065 family)